MIKKGFYSILAICLFAGCTKNSVTPVFPAVANTPTVEKVIAPTVTHLPDITLTPTLVANSIQQCIRLEQENKAIKDLVTGTILLFPYTQNSPNFLMDVETGKEYRLPTIGGGGAVSPDRNMFAYIEQIQDAQNNYVINNILWIVNAQANVLSKISFDQEYLGTPSWLDNSRIVMATSEFGTLLVVNSFTREQQIVSNELPNLATLPFPGGPWWRVEYNPNLEWVAYYYGDDSGRGTTVRDVLTGQNLWQSTSGDEGKPAWSPDGQEVAVVGDGQLYLVNRSGQAKPILTDDVIHKAQSPSWSPDGRYIVFWNSDGQSNYNLMAFDKRTGAVIDYCLKNRYYPDYRDIIWSPDSQHFIIDNQALVSGTILVDLSKATAYKILSASNSTVFGWMNSLP